MNADFFAMAQGRVAQAVEQNPALSQGMNAAAVKRCARMVAIGALAAGSFAAAAPDASAQTPEQVLNARLGEAARQVVGQQTRGWQGGNEAGQLVDMGVRATTGQRMAEGANVAIPAVGATLLLRLVKPKAKPAAYAVAGALGAGAGYAYNQMRQSEGSQGQVVNQNQNRYPQQASGPSFYSPRDMGMPEKFTQVSQRARIGMVQPGQFRMDLRDGTTTSNHMVRSIDQLQQSLQEHRRSQSYLEEARLSMYSGAPQQGRQVNNTLAITSQNVDRAIETYIRVSNTAGLHNLDTRPFNALVAKIVNENLVPEQQVNMSVNASTHYYRPR